MDLILDLSFPTNSRARIQDEKKLVEFERGVKEAEERRPAHQRKVDESEQNLAKATEDKKRLEATVGDISKKRDQFVSFSFPCFLSLLSPYAPFLFFFFVFSALPSLSAHSSFFPSLLYFLSFVSPSLPSFFLFYFFFRFSFLLVREKICICSQTSYVLPRFSRTSN